AGNRPDHRDGARLRSSLRAGGPPHHAMGLRTSTQTPTRERTGAARRRGVLRVLLGPRLPLRYRPVGDEAGLVRLDQPQVQLDQPLERADFAGQSLSLPGQAMIVEALSCAKHLAVEP